MVQLVPNVAYFRFLVPWLYHQISSGIMSHALSLPPTETHSDHVHATIIGWKYFDIGGWRNFYNRGWFLQMRLIFSRLCLIFRKWKFFTLVVVTRSKIPLPTKGKIFGLSATSYWPAIDSCAVLKNEGRQFEVCAKWIAIQQIFGQNKSCSRGL